MKEKLGFCKIKNQIFHLFTLTSCFAHAAPSQIIFTNSNQKLALTFFQKKGKINYLARYELTDGDSGRVLNKGKFEGCANGDVAKAVANYESHDRFLWARPIEDGFVIYNLVGCGAQSVWKLNVVTTLCVASAPATAKNGEWIDAGTATNTNKLKFGYLLGVGAERTVKEDYFSLKDGVIAHNSGIMPPSSNEAVIVRCKRHYNPF